MTPQNSPSKYAALILDIKNDIEARLSKLISDYFDSTELALSSASHDYLFDQRLADRFARMQLLGLIRTNKSIIEDHYHNSIKNLLRPFPVTEAEKKQQKLDSENELSLIDHSDIDDMVQIKNMGERIASNCREQISHLEARLEFLALRGDDIFQKRALSPINLCQAFDDALGDIFDISDKKLLFRLFNDSVANKLGTFYGEINDKLIDAGILPQINTPKLNKPRKKYLAFGRGTDVSKAQDTTADSQTTNAGQSQYSPGTTPESAAGTTNKPEGSEQADNIGNGYAMKAAPGQSRQSPTGREQYASQSATRRTIDNYFGRPVTQPQGVGSSEGRDFFPSSTPNDFGHEEILSALSNLQSSPEFQQPADMHFDAEAIKNAVINEIAKKSGGIVTKRINELATKTIDFIELIFDAIIEDDAISDTIKTLLLRLQIPIIKASLLDPEFFIQDTHPARVLLDRITEAGFGVTDHQDETYIELDQVVSIVLDEYILQTSTFQHALDRLNAYIEKQEEIAREKEEAAQKQVLREHARETVLKALRTITTGKTLPESIHPLVLKRWPTLMYNHYLTHGKENDEWISIIEALRAIVTSVQPITTAEEYATLKKNSEEILSRTHHYLEKTNRSDSDIENVLQGLRSVHEALLEKSAFSVQEIEAANHKISAEETDFSESTPADTNETTAEETIPQPRLPTSILPGMWFLIYMGEDKAPRRAKLSVIIVEDSRLVFVNHSGEIVVEKSFADFINEIDNDKSRMIMSRSVFDHALSSVIGQLQRD